MIELKGRIIALYPPVIEQDTMYRIVSFMIYDATQGDKFPNHAMVLKVPFAITNHLKVDQEVLLQITVV